MTALANFPQAALNLVLTMLLPLLLPATGDNLEAATHLALTMLAEYQPRTIQELRAAAKLIGLSLQTLQTLAEAAEPDLSPTRLATLRRSACLLSRSELQAQKALHDLQRARPADAHPQPQPQPHPQAARQPEPAPQPEPAETASPEENAYNAALKLLNQMKSHHKGAPPPHSSAAQQIQAQQRVVDTARMKLEQARRLHAGPQMSAAA